MSNNQNQRPEVETKPKQIQETGLKNAPFTPSDLYADFEFCAHTQESVNAMMTGENWREKALGQMLAEGEKPVDYPMALLDEAAEFWASTIDFKWWAKTDFSLDRGNAVVELVDMLHFALSQDLTSSQPEAVARAMDRAFSARGPINQDPQIALLNVRVAMKKFIHAITAEQPFVDWKAFWAMAVHLGVDPATLVYKYRAKALLNKFRTANGAKAGTYKKKWLDGKEDNYYLMLHLDSILMLGQPYPGDEALDEWLKSAYVRMTSIQSV